jgi:LysR family transcriptional regulator for bpeEF and oprC
MSRRLTERQRHRLRVEAATALCSSVLGPSIPKFVGAFPELSVDLSAPDQVIDPIAEGIDVVVRMAELRESVLGVSRRSAARAVVGDHAATVPPAGGRDIRD